MFEEASKKASESAKQFQNQQLEKAFGWVKDYAGPNDPLKAPDRLQKIFQQQKMLFDKVVDLRKLEGWNQTTWVEKLTGALQDEVQEVRAEIPWKWWKEPFQVDVDNIQGEVVDLWLFLVQLTIVVGMTPQDLFEKYAEKTGINVDRWDGNSTKPGYVLDND